MRTRRSLWHFLVGPRQHGVGRLLACDARIAQAAQGPRCRSDGFHYKCDPARVSVRLRSQCIDPGTSLDSRAALMASPSVSPHAGRRCRSLAPRALHPSVWLQCIRPDAAGRILGGCGICSGRPSGGDVFSWLQRPGRNLGCKHIGRHICIACCGFGAPWCHWWCCDWVGFRRRVTGRTSGSAHAAAGRFASARGQPSEPSCW